MKLIDTLTGEAHYCGLLKKRPDYTCWHMGTSAEIDGTPARMHNNCMMISNVVTFELGGKWWQTSSAVLAGKVRKGRTEALLFEAVFTGKEGKAGLRAKALGHLFSGYTEELIGDSPIAKAEKRDCTVRALMEAVGLTYDEAHARMEASGRRGKSGIWMARTLERDFKGEFEDITGRWRGKTVGTFARDHQEGRYIVMVRGHALAVVDGKIKDWWLRPNRRIKEVFRYIGQPVK